MTAAKADHQKGLPLPSGKLTLGAFMTAWLAFKLTAVKVSTWERYDQLTRDHVLPALGHLPLKQIVPLDLQELYERCLTEKGLAARTVAFIHRVVHMALQHALRVRELHFNAAACVTPPRVDKKEMTSLTAAEARAVLQAAVGHRLEALFILALTTGLREGELLALRISDLDLVAGQLRVVRTVRRIKGQGFQFSEPKTPRARRTIRLPVIAIVALKAHLERLSVEREAAGPGWERSSDLVFPNQVGRSIEPTHLLRREWHPLLKKAGVRQVRFHDARHSCASILLDRPEIRLQEVSELLGHAKTSITLDIYAHVISPRQRDLTSAMDQLFLHPAPEVPQDQADAGTASTPSDDPAPGRV